MSSCTSEHSYFTRLSSKRFQARL